MDGGARIQKLLQLFYVPVVECPRLTPVEKRGESQSIVDSQLGRQPNVVLTEHSVSDYDFTSVINYYRFFTNQNAHSDSV